MAGLGFDYEPVVYVDSDIAFGRVSNPLNEVVATEYGYHTPPLPQIVDVNAGQGAAFQEALAGSDDRDGCGLTAVQEVREPGLELFQLYASVVADLDLTIGEFWASDLASTLSQEWSSCMREQGYNYSSPLEPPAQFAASPSVSATELATRSADLECDQTVELTRSRSMWEQQRFEEWLADHEGELIELNRLGVAYDGILQGFESETL